jgi:multidrug resistance protein
MKSKLGIVFLTVLVDLLGFGIIIPLLPFYALEFKAKPTTIGFLSASYSMMQFIFNPIWGRVSDRVGRRPVILLSVFGSFVSYLIFAFASSLNMLFLSRILAGIMGGNIATSQAYIADITSPEERAKGMGMVGAAFGIGFIFGPFIGGMLSKINFTAPGLFASFLSLSNFILAYRFLPESRDLNARSTAGGGRVGFIHILRQRFIPILFFSFFVITFGISLNYVVFPLFTGEMFNFRASHNGLLFGYIGAIGALMQGYVIGKLARRFSEEQLLSVGTSLMSAGLFGIFISSGFTFFIIFVSILAIGGGITTPSVLSLISKYSDPKFQGSTLGMAQSLSSLARIFGPSTGGFVYDNFGHRFPFFLGGFALGASFLLSIRIFKRKEELVDVKVKG